MGRLFKCHRCGKCCQNIPLRQEEFEMFRYILKRAGEWNPDRITYHPDKKVYKWEGTCPFIEVNEGKAHCEIYSFRPIICKLYPLSDECGTSSKINKTETDDG